MGKSTVDIAVENTGNVRLKPVADFVLRAGWSSAARGTSTNVAVCA